VRKLSEGINLCRPRAQEAARRPHSGRGGEGGLEPLEFEITGPPKDPAQRGIRRHLRGLLVHLEALLLLGRR
jgi:hypothetical protein